MNIFIYEYRILYSKYKDFCILAYDIKELIYDLYEFI